MKYIQLILNFSMLLFWIRLWTLDDLEFYFNPFLARLSLLTDRVFEFFLPVLRIPEFLFSCLAFLFLGTLKAFIAGRFGGGWDITIGSLFHFTYPFVADGSLGPHFIFAGISFAFFIVRLWTVYFFVCLITPYYRRLTRAMELFDFIARPMSWCPVYFQGILLIMMHWILACLVVRFGDLSVVSLQNLQLQAIAFAHSPFHVGPQSAALLNMVYLTFLSFLDGLSALTNSLVFLIVVNILASLFGSKLFQIISHEVVGMLMGRFARSKNVSTTGLDFRPLFFFLIVNFIYGNASLLLYKLIMK